MDSYLKPSPLRSFFAIFITEATQRDLFSGSETKRYETQELPKKSKIERKKNLVAIKSLDAVIPDTSCSSVFSV